MGVDLVDVIVRVQVSGARNGADWPSPGSKWVLPRDEAEGYAAVGLVDIVPEKAPHKKAAQWEPDAHVERAVAAEDLTVEKRGPHTRSGPLTTKNAP